MIPVLNLLNMGGGQGTVDTDSRNTLFVQRENTTLFAQKGSNDMLTVYIDIDADAKLVNVDWSGWLGTSTIASSTWKVQEGSTAIVISNQSNTATVATGYLDSVVDNQNLFIKNTIVTNDAIPRTEPRSILVKTLRTV